MSRSALCFLFQLATLALLMPSLQAQESLQPICHFDYLWDDQVNDVVTMGDYAYLACGNDGIRIVDIQSPENPRFLSRLEGSSIYRIHMHAGVLYAQGSGHIQIYQLDDPAQPVLIQDFEPGTWVNSMSFDGQRMLVQGRDSASVWRTDLFDCTNPAELVLQSLFGEEVAGGDEALLRGDQLLVASTIPALLVYDLSDPENAVLSGSHSSDYGNWAFGVEEYAGYALLAAGGDGFKVIRLEDMELVAHFPELAYAFHVEVKGDLAFVSFGDPDCPIAAIDLTDPENPIVRGMYEPPMDLIHFAVSGDFVYAADFSRGFRVVDFSDLDHPVEIAALDVVGDVYDVLFAGSDVLYTRELNCMRILDLTDPQQPEVLGMIHDHWPTDFLLDEHLLLTLDGEQEFFKVYSTIDPMQPQLLSSWGLPEGNVYHYRMAADAGYVYINENSGIRILDYSNPDEISEAGFLAISSLGNANLGLAGGYLFVEDHYDLKVYDLTDPGNPELLYTDQGSFVIDMFELGAYLALIEAPWDMDPRVRLVDLQELDQHLVIHELDLLDGTQRASNLILEDEHLFVTAQPRVEGLSCQIIEFEFDQEDRTLNELARVDSPGYCYGADLHDGVLALANTDFVSLYDVTGSSTGLPGKGQLLPESFTMLSCAPNPFNPTTVIHFNLEQSARVEMDIYDVLGRHLTQLLCEELPAGPQQLVWAPASELASGRYFLKASSSGDVRVLPLLYLK